MNIDEEREELRRKVESLNDVGAMLERIKAQQKYILTIAADERSPLQRLWILAFDGAELKMAAGTDQSVYEAGLDFVTLDFTREYTIKGYHPEQDQRPRFSLFGRRR